MFKIRKEQEDAFLLHDEKAFVDFIIEHLREEHYNYVSSMPDSMLVGMVSNGLTRARSHGLTDPENLTAFVALMFVMAPNFDEHPVFQKILDDESIPVDQRLDRLLIDELNSCWEEAEKNYNGDAWFPELQDEEEDEDAKDEE
ncbi:MAG: hypothetical protein ABH886_04850 [Candidatus Desantisbacteria bacterium]